MFTVRTSTFVRPRAASWESIWIFWVRELETAVILAFGKCAAIHRVSDPQPQPSSRIRWPSSSPARSQVIASIRASDSSMSVTPSSQ